MSKLVVLGSVNADHVVQVPSFPRPGETLTASGYQVIAGGKGANQAVAAARLGADIAFIACVGDDDFGARMLTEYQALGMEVSGLMTAEQMTTGVAMIQVADNGENSICIAPGANAALTPARLAPHLGLIAAADTLLMQLETPLDTIYAAATTAKDAGTLVVLNPAPAMALSDELLAKVDIITPNETEAEFLTGIKVDTLEHAAQAATELHAKGIATVMITLGSQGVYLSERGQGQHIAGFSVAVKDTTAAGDTFNAAMLTGLQQGMNLPDAIVLAHGAAALSVSRFGAQTSIPMRSEVDEFLATHRR
ncbi:ribokinase [Shewanella sp. NIFS-20-20]|uniref:ribokinase n=1 Tax=Shewanella sp. NIFS-20-20 TaxID=2853806 RepID=UPI001C452FB4|nr:ribokinase [Shewanella sp. NIFS-20-20]MBV7315396.1 ribokinase [Shewanella sp. NIFS-20-20]